MFRVGHNSGSKMEEDRMSESSEEQVADAVDMEMGDEPSEPSLIASPCLVVIARSLFRDPVPSLSS